MENASSSFYMEVVPTLAPLLDKNLKFTLRIVVQVLVMILGVPGNGLILLVYKHKRQKTSTHIFIMTLAMADLSVCLMRVLDIADEHLRYAGYKGVKAINLLRPLDYTAVGTTIVLTSLIAADRYDCVCRPRKRFFTQRGAKIAALSSLVASLAVNTPALIEEIVNSGGVPMIVFVLAFQLTAYMTNLIMIVICYSLVYITVRKHVQVGIQSSVTGGSSRNIASVSTPNNTGRLPVQFIFQPGSSTSAETSFTSRENNMASLSSLYAHISPSEETAKSQPFENTLYTQQFQRVGQFRVAPKRNAPASVLQRKTTKMLFIASVVFLLTWTPYWIFVGKRLALKMGIEIDPIFHVVTDETRSFVYINNIVNPLIYGFSNSRFRKDCQVVLRKMRCF